MLLAHNADGLLEAIDLNTLEKKYNLALDDQFILFYLSIYFPFFKKMFFFFAFIHHKFFDNQASQSFTRILSRVITHAVRLVTFL
jgi:hypothetical protein